MRTAVLSDLHLGTATGEDLLRDPEIRRHLLERLAGADRLVLLGDVVELREEPLPAVLPRSRPFFEELGEALAGREVVIVPGNHDHRLAEPLLERVGAGDGPLGLEQTGSPWLQRTGSPAVRSGRAGDGPGTAIADWLGEASLTVAYPGIWLRDDLYATHGQYMDCHMRLPRIECLATATVMRIFGPVPPRAAPADYERVLQPIYGFAHGMAQSGLAERAHRPSERAWRSISGQAKPPGRLRRARIRATVSAGIPAAVWGLNKLLRADFDPELSAAAISRAGIEAAIEMCGRLGLEGVDVLTGHTHRAGPLPEEAEWALAGGGRLHNTGSWVYASAFHRPGTPPGPYWPGTLTWVEDAGPPRRERLLTDRSAEELRETVRRLAHSSDLSPHASRRS